MNKITVYAVVDYGISCPKDILTALHYCVSHRDAGSFAIFNSYNEAIEHAKDYLDSDTPEMAIIPLEINPCEVVQVFSKVVIEKISTLTL